MIDPQPISEAWLKSAGFKWHQFDRQPDKHWLLWLGDALGRHRSYEDLGIELAPNVPSDTSAWFCWLRDDSAGHYHRFIHIRHLHTVDELVALIEGIIGRRFDPANSLYGFHRTPEQAARIRQEDERLDRRLMRSGYPWSEAEKDATRGGPLAEHQDHHIETFEGKDGRRG